MNDTIRDHVRALTEQVDQVTQDGRNDDPHSPGWIDRHRGRAQQIEVLEQVVAETLHPLTSSTIRTEGRGKLGVGKARITVRHNPLGWRHDSSHRPGWRVCSDIVTSGCRDGAVWSVETWRRHMVATGYYCAEHLPAEHVGGGAKSLSEPGPVVTIRALQVSAIVVSLDVDADRVLRRAVPAAARHHRPDGTVAVSLARLPGLREALTAAGYVVQPDEGVGR